MVNFSHLTTLQTFKKSLKLQRIFESTFHVFRHELAAAVKYYWDKTVAKSHLFVR